MLFSQDLWLQFNSFHLFNLRDALIKYKPIEFLFGLYDPLIIPLAFEVSILLHLLLDFVLEF